MTLYGAPWCTHRTMASTYPRVDVLFPGYSTDVESVSRANCSCVLVRAEGGRNMVVDPMTAWDAGKIVGALALHGLTPDDISFVVATHGHCDHVGCLSLFTKARHIVGYDIHEGDVFYTHDFTESRYIVWEGVSVMATPGHTKAHVSVVVETGERRVVVVAGDLFEKEEDIADGSIWREAGSEDEGKQRKNRKLVANLAHEIIPGHGPAFLVTPAMREALTRQAME